MTVPDWIVGVLLCLNGILAAVQLYAAAMVSDIFQFDD